MADYNPAQNAYLATQQAGALADAERKDAAYQAIKNTYGVALAGDPDTTLKAQEFQQRDKLNPIAVEQAGANLTGTNLQNQGTAATNAYNELANPKRLQALDDTHATSAQALDEATQLQPGKVAQQSATLAGTEANTAQTRAQTAETGVRTQAAKFALNTAEGAQLRSSAMGLLAGLSDVAANGGDMGAAFDKIAPQIAQFEGVDQAHIAPLRQKFIDDPVGTINQLSSAINAINLQAAGGTKAGALNMLKFNGQQMSLKEGLQFTQQRTGAVPDLTDQMANLLPLMSTVPTVAMAKMKIPGTPEYQFHQLTEQLKANTSLDDIRTLKATGTSLGRVTNNEMALAGNAIANMDIGQPKATLLANLKRVKTTYTGLNQNIQADIDRIGKGGMGTGAVKGPTGPAGATAKAVNKKTGQTIFQVNGAWVNNDGTPVK